MLVFPGQRQALDLKPLISLPALLALPPPPGGVASTVKGPKPKVPANQEERFARIYALIFAGVSPTTVSALLNRRGVDPAILGGLMYLCVGLFIFFMRQ